MSDTNKYLIACLFSMLHTVCLYVAYTQLYSFCNIFPIENFEAFTFQRN